MHAQISLNYTFETVAAKWGPDQYERIRNLMPALDLPEVQPEKVSLGYDKREHLIDLTTTGVALTELGVTFEIKRFKSTYRVADSTHHHLHVAIPNLLLFAVDEVQVLEDVCTGMLQEHLDDGWRILAVCPPAAQRRPDYVMGRQKGATS